MRLLLRFTQKFCSLNVTFAMENGKEKKEEKNVVVVKEQPKMDHVIIKNDRYGHGQFPYINSSH